MASGDENGVMAWLNRVKVSNKKSRETITSEAAGKASAAEAIQTGSKHSRTSAASSSSSSSSSSYSALSLDGSHAAVALKKRPSSANVKQSRKAKSAGNKAGKAAAKAGAGRGKKRQLGGDEEEEEEEDDDDDDAFVFLKTERRKGMGAEQLKGFKDKHSLVELTASPYVSGHCFFDATGESQRHQEQPKIYGKRKRPHMRDLVSLVFRYAAHLDGGLYSVKVGEDGRRRGWQREKKKEKKKEKRGEEGEGGKREGKRRKRERREGRNLLFFRLGFLACGKPQTNLHVQGTVQKF